MSASQEDANKLIKEKYPNAKWNAEKKAWEFPEEDDPFAEVFILIMRISLMF